MQIDKRELEIFYEKIGEHAELRTYFANIQKMDSQNQNKIFDCLRIFLEEKKQKLLRKVKYNATPTERELLKSINYWLHQISIQKNNLNSKPYNNRKISNDSKKKVQKNTNVTDKNNEFIQKKVVCNDNSSKNFDDELSYKQQEILAYMKLKADIKFCNINDIILAYKFFLRNINIIEYWDYINELTNFLCQELNTLSYAEANTYKHMICDSLKYLGMTIDKDNVEVKKKIKQLQYIWKNISLENKISINEVSATYKMEIKKIMIETKLDKKEAHIIWLNSIEDKIINCNNQELETIIEKLLEAKNNFKDSDFQINLSIFLNKYVYLFENYFESHIINMNIPKSKQEILNKLKELIQNRQMDNSSKTYQLFCTIIFKEKNLCSLQNLLSLDPKFINIRDQEGKYLLETIINLLINSHNKEEQYFFKNVLLMFFKYAGIYMNQELKNNIDRILDDAKRNISDENSLDCILSNLNNKLDSILLLNELKVTKESVYIHEKNKTSYKLFKNMLNRNIITIDQKNTKYFENAISCDQLKNGNYQIGIYVSDIVDCLQEDLIIESNDLRHKEFKMERNRYKKNILKERKQRNVLAFTFIVDDNLNVIKFSVDRARIRVKKNYTYEDVIQILDDADSENKQFYVLQRMNNIARKMYRKRNPNGYLKKYMDFIPEIQREFTLFLNHYVAKDASKQDMPLIFKNNVPRNSDLHEQLKNVSQTSDYIEQITKTIYSDKVPNYSTIDRGNSYFGGESYTQLTCPTRELVSLLNQILVIYNYIDSEYISEEQEQNFQKTLMLLNHFNDLRNR